MSSRLWMPCSLALLSAAWAGQAAAAQPASALGDHMVLQRDKPAPIWGTAKVGEKVTVRFAGQAKTAAAGKDGRWIVRLDPLKASTEPRELTVEGPSGSVTIKDVLVGDVWIAGGQSNMGRDVRRSWTPKDQRMDYPHIRFLAVRSRGSKYPRRELVPPPPPSKPPRTKRLTASNRWHVCTDRTTPECCAVGFFFAERIYKQTGIPQGLLWNAWAGSTAKEWIPRFGWSLRPQLAETAEMVDSWYPSTNLGRAAFQQAVEEIAAWTKQAALAVRRGHPFPYPQPLLPQPDDSRGNGRGTTILYNGRVHPLVPYAVKGILWYQGESDYANRRYLPEIEAMAESWRKLLACPGEKMADLPFYFVQMQRCGSYMSPEIRNHQFESYFTIPNAGMAVLLDLDMNLHPANKYDSGRRMALWALARDYGREVIHSGPLYRGRRVEGERIVVEFTHTHGGLFIGAKNKLAEPKAIPGGKLVNVEITADGRNWVPAQSKIDGERLIVWADGLSKPTDVRYCWKSKADEPFLYNKAGLPAAQFNSTTDYAFGGRRPAAAKRGDGRRGSARRRRDDAARREVRLAGAFGENAVLQRGVEVPVWGHGPAGEEVTVTFAGQTKTAAADRFGRWRVELDAMGASAEPRPLVAKGSTTSARIEPVFVGDVWLYLTQNWHLGGPAELRVDEKSLPPICARATADIWEPKSHSRRPRTGAGDRGARWSIYRAPGRYYRNDGYYLGLGLARVTGVPVGSLALGASTLESMTPPGGFEAFESELGDLGRTVTTWTTRTQRGRQAHLEGIEAIEEWVEKARGIFRRDRVTFRDLTQPPRLPGPPEYRQAPTTHYNFATCRFMPAAMRGIIIQPKTFSLGDPMYATKAKALIRGLREACGRKGLPVCFVQMHTPGRYELKETEDPNDWVTMRAAQNQLAKVPHTTVIASYDLKSPARSEPDLGLRAAQWAAAIVKGAAIKTGPTYRKHRADGASVIVEFDQVGKGLTPGESATGKPVRPTPDAALAGFQLAGADHRWHDATAAIEGSTVVVTCAKVKRPTAVRYAWTPQPKAANLYNRAGFPALPFCTAK